MIFGALFRRIDLTKAFEISEQTTSFHLLSFTIFVTKNEVKKYFKNFTKTTKDARSQKFTYLK